MNWMLGKPMWLVALGVLALEFVVVFLAVVSALAFMR